MSAELNYTTGDAEPQSFEPIPPNWYHARIVESGVLSARSGNGSYLKLKLQVDGDLHPEVGSRVLFTNLNLWNESDKAVAIAKSTMEAICRALGFAAGHVVRDSAELHEKLLQVRVVVVEDPQRGPGNEVKGFRPAAGPQERHHAAPQQRQAAPAAAAPQRTAPQQGQAPAWHRK